MGVNTVNNQKVWKYYKLNKVTGKCVEQLTLVANCITYDDNWLCTKCNDGYDVKEGECALKTPLETPLGQYGCKTFDGSKCT